ncbi:hypothetical protein N657DRAFT_629636 [Parathielavia appendiculata]|uniref:Uncharacterized protein n=1 Tax=Parathielavia appendiculata TaxID=2587402 RepID=A0AAN6Z8I7_9PEZI|nr:hypothetical protein N657DRAFT_629636 [Parathielavia appendiculata]
MQTRKSLVGRAWVDKSLKRAARLVGAVTVNLDLTRSAPAQFQQAAIDRVRECLAPETRRQRPSPADVEHDSAVIVASRSLAAWLHDDGFVSHMLAAAGLTHACSKELTVLTAAVDEVPRYDARLDLFGSSEGISVLRGVGRTLMPYPFDPPSAKRSSRPPSLRISLPPTYWPGRLTVEVPLANTVFANGSPHTLYASRWRSDSGSAPTLAERFERRYQSINLTRDDLGFHDRSFSTVIGNLIPVTTPRKVLGSLGNIVSQIEIDGQSAPASKELESIVPSLLEQRRRLQGENQPVGPVGVWALTIPHRYMEARLPTLAPLQLNEYRPEDELRLARAAADELDWFIAARCRFHRVLSGGGGWGAKRGLLSLDPQTSLATDESQNLENFIRSFEGNAGGIVKPGTFVQFFVEAANPTREGLEAPSPRRWGPGWNSDTVTTVFGTSGAALNASPLDVVNSCPSLFGAISTEGVYVFKSDIRQSTKLDVPRSYLLSHQRFPGPPMENRTRVVPPTQKVQDAVPVLDVDQYEHT